MSKDAVNFLTNLKEEIDKYIADVDLEAVEKATREYADVIAGVDQKMQELRKKIQKM